MPGRFTWIAGLATCLLTATLAAGQVLPTQSGRELDRNYRMGSRGFNTMRGTEPFYGPNSSQLLITGQITRGRAFRGNVPYAAGDQLRLTLPSTGIDDFNRDAIGVSRILETESAFVPQPYFTPSRTVVSARAIDQGQNLPGGSVPRTPSHLLPSLNEQLRIDAIADYAPLAAPPTVLNYRVDLPIDQAPLVAPTIVSGPSPVTSSLYGALGPAERARLASELAAAAGMLPAAGQIDTRTDASVQARVEGEVPALDLMDTTRVPGDVPNLAAPQEQELAVTGMRPPEAVGPQAMQPPLVPNQDAFDDMLVELQARREARQAALAAEATASRRPGPALTPDGELQPAATERPATTVQPRTPIEQPIPLNTLAGQREDLFNRHLARGEELLRNGRFYDASASFQTAMILQRDNPLPTVGAALAHFGAGEYATAAQWLNVAIRTFPPLMEVRVDVAAMVGEQTLDRRMTWLAERFGDRAAPAEIDHVFLMAWLNHNLDRPEQAQQWAHTLADLAGQEQDTVLAGFARYVLTGQHPAERARELRDIPTTLPDPATQP